MQTKLLENGVGKIPTETRGQSWKSLSAGEHAVPGPHQRPVERARTKQLLSQQCRPGETVRRVLTAL